MYIEYVILDNLTIDLLILWLTLRTLRERVPRLRLVLSAALGTAGACVMPLASLPPPALFACKIALSVAMILLVRGKRKFLLYILCFYGYTFALGGAAVGLFYLLRTEFGVSDGALRYELEVPIGLILAAVALTALAATRLVRTVRRIREREGYYRQVRLFLGECSAEATGYVDSGNLLSHRGSPVILADVPTVLRLFGIADFSELDCHKIRFESIEINTVNGKRSIPVFRLDRLLSGESEYRNLYCGISFEPFRTSCGVLLNCMTR